MNQIFIAISQDIDKLMARLYLDIGKYSFERVPNGLLIQLNEEDPASLQQFVKRFAKWFSEQAFIENGDIFFANHPHKEKWQIWKSDIRFRMAYFDEFAKRYMEKKWVNWLQELEDWDYLEFQVETFFEEYYDIVKVRMEMIAEHFTYGIHEDYIALRYKQAQFLQSHHQSSSQ